MAYTTGGNNYAIKQKLQKNVAPGMKMYGYTTVVVQSIKLQLIVKLEATDTFEYKTSHEFLNFVR